MSPNELARIQFSRTVARPRWNERQARIVLEALDASGETIEKFARRHGVKEERLAAWGKRLGRAWERMPPCPEELFIPVHVMDDREDAEPDRDAAEGSGVELALPGGRVVQISVGFDRDTLARVVAGDWPYARLDELLPSEWKKRQASKPPDDASCPPLVPD